MSAVITDGHIPQNNGFSRVPNAKNAFVCDGTILWVCVEIRGRPCPIDTPMAINPEIHDESSNADWRADLKGAKMFLTSLLGPQNWLRQLRPSER